jgi:hypothetical protein
MTKKILIFGLPGSGKTTLAKALSSKLNAVHWNADAVRANINKDLGFSEEDRIEQARRMGWLCDQVNKSGQWAIADFVCPTEKTREAFGDSIKIWVDTIKEGRFEDTNKIFEPPQLSMCDFRVYSQDAEFWAKYIYEDLDISQKPSFIKMLFRSELV